MPFYADPCDVYARLRTLGEPVLLDSGDERGRFDVIAAQADSTQSLFIPATATADELKASLSDWQVLVEQQIQPRGAEPELPFCGGYIGHFSYELGRRLHGLPAAQAATLPLAVVRYYPWAVVQDRKLRKSWLVGEQPALEHSAADIAQRLYSPSSPGDPAHFKLMEPFHCRWSLEDYQHSFEAVKRYISAGDCYQINIGQPFSARYEGALLEAYRALRTVAKAPFSAFFPLTSGQTLLSLSPERLLAVDERKVETRPIKGTRPRHEDPAADQVAAAELIASGKERAENLMIVDLLRNDIGRFCDPGSVQADELFRLESYATVHHLVSVVSGRLSEKHTALDLLIGCLPGGSITGAPKHRAMQIIDELEPAPRQAWCGSLFYLSRHGRLDSSIAIRTLFSDNGQLHCWAGGGLVDDSEIAAEYQEQLDKVGAFLRTLEGYGEPPH
jgi:para-aminobenzoate synthetase component 1